MLWALLSAIIEYMTAEHEERIRRTRGSKFVPIDTCLICDGMIYTIQRYGMFSDGYGHEECIAFVRLQAAMMRSASEG